MASPAKSCTSLMDLSLRSLCWCCFFLFFFAPQHTLHTSSSHSAVRAQTILRKQPHAASPAKRKSCSTSWSARVLPSAPRAPGSSSRCHSTGCGAGEERAPTKAPRLPALDCATSGSHFAPWPWPEETRKSSFPRTIFLRLRQLKQPASELVAPATQDTGAPSGDGLPSAQPHQSQLRVPLECHPCGEHTPVWCPPPAEHRRAASHQRRLRASARQRHQGGPRSRSRMKMFVETLPPASRHMRATTFSKLHPRLLCARCTVMAKFIKWEATPAGAHGKAEREAQATQESDAEQLRGNGRDAARRARHQSHCCTRPALGPDRGLGAGAQPGIEQQIPELLLGPARGLVLPSWSSAVGFEIILIPRRWSCAQHFVPRRKFEAWDSGHLSGNISCSSQTQTLRFSLQLHHQTSCHVWVAGKHHSAEVSSCSSTMQQDQPCHIADLGPTEFGLATVGASRSPSPKNSERTQGDPKESRGLSILVGREGDPNLSTPQHWGPTPSQSSRAHHRWEVVFRPGSRSSS